MKRKIKTTDDFNEIITEIIDEYLEDFKEREGLTRPPEEEDIIDLGEVEFMYTQKGMRLYDSACKKLVNLGKKSFPEDEQNISVLNCGNMLMP